MEEDESTKLQTKQSSVCEFIPELGVSQKNAKSGQYLNVNNLIIPTEILPNTEQLKTSPSTKRTSYQVA